MRIITTAPGIGDFLWIVMKLINANEKFDFIFPVKGEHVASKENVHTRAFQLQPLLPNLINSSSHYNLRFEGQIRPFAHRGKWSDLNGFNEMKIEANTHLERAKEDDEHLPILERSNRIERFLPDLPTSFHIDFKTSDDNVREAAEIIEKVKGHKLCGIYTSNHAKSRGSWLASEWVEFIKLIQKSYPEYKFIFIGADYDSPLTCEVYSHFGHEDYAVCVNEDLGTALEVMKRLDIFVAFQSGMAIMNELIGAKQTVMLYWDDQKHRNIIEAWPDKKRIESGEYKGCVFCPPQKIFDWLIENKKL